MDNLRAGKKENRRQSRPRGGAPSRAEALSAAEAFAPFLRSRIPKPSTPSLVTLAGDSYGPELEYEPQSPPRLWDLLQAMLWPRTPGLRTTAGQGEETTCPFCKLLALSGRCPQCGARWTGTRWERSSIDRGQAKEIVELKREIAEGKGCADVWNKLRTYEFKAVALRCVSHGSLIRWLEQRPDVLAEVLRKDVPSLDAVTADALARSGPDAYGSFEIARTIARGMPVTFAWVVHIVSVIDYAIEAMALNMEISEQILEELAACVLFGFRPRWCQAGHHWCFADEHFRGRCVDHQLAAQKPRTRLRLKEVMKSGLTLSR